MAGTKISALTAVATATGADEFPVNEAGTTKKSTLTQLLTWILSQATFAFGSATPTFIGGATGIYFDNHANTVSNMVISDAGVVAIANDLQVGDSTQALNGRIKISQDNPPTIGSTGSGVSAASIIAGSTNTAGQAQATLTAVAPGVVIGVVAFDDAPLASAPKVVVCSLSAPTAGDAAPPNIGADTYTTSGFTLRSYGPTTVTTATYIISWIAIF